MKSLILLLTSAILAIPAFAQIPGEGTTTPTPQQELKQLILENRLIREETKNALLHSQIGAKRELIRLELAQLELEHKRMKISLARLDNELRHRNKMLQLLKTVGPKPALANPYTNGVLTISHRTIDMPPVLLDSTVGYMQDRINFHNLQNDKPIFLVVNECYGGSLSAGTSLIKTIQDSKAPVYMVVRTYCASMCAIIASHIQRAYAYPNATFFHHDINMGLRGSHKRFSYEVRLLDKWAERLLKPVARKMGMTVKEFRNQLNADDKPGYWIEFADDAAKMGWLTEIPKSIIDQSALRPRKFAYYTSRDHQYNLLRNKTGQIVLTPPRNGDGYYLDNSSSKFVIDDRNK